MTSLADRLCSVVGVRWSALAVDIDSGRELFELDADRVCDTASIRKVFLLHRLLTEVDAGTRSLEDTVTRRPVEWMDNSGLWYLLHADTLTLYDVAALIGAVSDNAATNTLARVVGLDAVQEHTRDLGYHDSGLNDVVRWPIPPGAPGMLSHGTARELVRFCARLATGADLSHASAETLRRWLGARHGPVDGRLRVRPRPARALLLRPRNLVVEQDRNHLHGARRHRRGHVTDAAHRLCGTGQLGFGRRCA